MISNAKLVKHLTNTNVCKYLHVSTGAGEVPVVDPLVPNKIANNDVSTSLVLGEKKKKPRKKRRNNVTKKPPDAPKRFKRFVLCPFNLFNV